jgi:ssDNA-binding Zn-finger/Zn-ribbon topoisomerase 1
LKNELGSFGGESRQICPDCGQDLRHAFKPGEGGFNFWSCENRDFCGAKFKDQNGKPGPRMAKSELTDQKCPDCGQPLRRITKKGPGGFDIWACVNKDNCGAVFNDDGDRPGERDVNNFNNELTDHICPDCGRRLRHIVKEGANGFNFWGCDDRDNCGATFNDDNGQPGAKSAKNVTNELSGYDCPDCGLRLRHIVKEGADGFNFWACDDRKNCGAKFKDNDGAPGDKYVKSELTDHKCPDCGQPLQHIVKDGVNGFNFWSCFDRENCGATFNDQGGVPGEKNANRTLTDHKCPDCGQALRHIVKDGANGYNFWACSDRNCGAKFNDDGGAPGPKNAKRELTDYKCPDCGQPLLHIVKTGVNGYNFWACSVRNCGATFNDDGGAPGPKNAKRELSDHKCPDCGQPLRHIVKDGANGYNFWACSDRSCGAKFNDDGGAPGQQNAKRELTDQKCQVCGQRLFHIVKKGEDGYDFWACSDRSCGTTYQNMDGQPGPKSAPRSQPVDSEFKCLACQSPLRHLKGLSRKTGENYDFFVCSNQDCNAKYQTLDDKPNFKTASGDAFREALPRDI